MKLKKSLYLCGNLKSNDMSKIYVGLDNGVSGSIGIVGDDIESVFVKTPVKKVQDYTKAKKEVSRLDYSKFMERSFIMDTSSIESLKLVRKTNQDLLNFFNDSYISKLEQVQSLKTELTTIYNP